MKKTFTWVLLGLGVLLLSGCFETEFDFKTIVRPDGSVFRETRIEGRGGRLFKVPAGPGWQVKAWETKGKETILADVYYHRVATGRFLPSQAIPSDYEFNAEELSKNWDEDDKKHLEAAGVKPPYEQNLYSRNRIQIQRVKGWLTETYFYEEVFETAGLIDLLTSDIKEDIKKQNNDRAALLGEEETNELVRLRLEDEYLSQIRFHGEVWLPGRIVSSNAQRIEKGKAVWKFSARDFGNHYSTYTLRAVSRSVSLLGMIFLMFIGGGGLFLILLLLLGFLKGRHKARSRGKRKQRGDSDREEVH